MELCFQAVSQMGKSGCFLSYVQSISLRRRSRICDDRRYYRQGPSFRPRRKRGTLCQAIGRSRGGITTKILALTDALGNLVDFCLMPETDALITGVSAGHLLADRAFDADWLRNDLLERGITPVIPPKSNRKSRQSSTRKPTNGGT